MLYKKTKDTLFFRFCSDGGGYLLFIGRQCFIGWENPILIWGHIWEKKQAERDLILIAPK